MDFKKLFLRLWRMTVSPLSEWENIMKESPRQDVAFSFVFPLTAISGTAVLIGGLLRDGVIEGGWWKSLSDACIVSIALLTTFWFTAWVANEVRIRYLKMDNDLPACFLLTGYSMAVMFILVIFTGLFVELLIFRYVLQFYVVYVVWHGVDVVMKVNENQRMNYTLIVSALLLSVPFLFRFIFDRLMTIVL
jgi:hypothetical protein